MTLSCDQTCRMATGLQTSILVLLPWKALRRPWKRGTRTVDATTPTRRSTTCVRQQTPSAHRRAGHPDCGVPDRREPHGVTHVLPLPGAQIPPPPQVEERPGSSDRAPLGALAASCTRRCPRWSPRDDLYRLGVAPRFEESLAVVLRLVGPATGEQDMPGSGLGVTQPQFPEIPATCCSCSDSRQTPLLNAGPEPEPR